MKRGAKIVAVSDVNGAVYDERGARPTPSEALR